MIFGCLAFTFYALLVFFHRMYPRPSPGKRSPALSPVLGWDREQHEPHSRAFQQNARKCLFYCCFLSPFPALSCPQSLGSSSSAFAFFFCWRSQGKKQKSQTAPASLGCSLAEIQGISRAAIQGQLSGSGKSFPGKGFWSYHLSLELLVVFIRKEQRGIGKKKKKKKCPGVVWAVVGTGGVTN